MLKNRIKRYISENIELIRSESSRFEKKIEKRLDRSEICDLRQKKKVFLMGTAEHRNLGDIAITLAEQEIVLKYFPEYYQVEFSTYEIDEKCYKKIQAIANRQDIFVFNGGGNIGDKYIEEEKLRRKIMEDFPSNKIIIFPQTICFGEDEHGQSELHESMKIYNRHQDLSIFVRGKQSLAMAKEYFKNAKVELSPDCVMYLEHDYRLDRDGIIINLRSDSEGILDEHIKNSIQDLAKKKSQNIIHTNNMAEEDVGREDRASVVNNELKKYAKSEVVVTDRLHGMIFAAVTHTPCVVLSTYNQKLKEYYDAFFKDTNAVVFLEEYDVSKVEQAIDDMLNIELAKYPIFDKINFQNLRNF